jgi:hypothetical protein
MLKHHYIHMECGCVLPVKKTTDIRYCPEHDLPKKYFTRPCLRCGKMERVQHLNHVHFLCDDCDRLLQQSRVIYNNHGLPFIDPVLWHKTPDEIMADMAVNLFLGYEEIQIDAPLRVQHQKETITIRMKEKVENLVYMKTKPV